MAFTASGSNPITYQGTPQADQGIFTTSNFIALGEGGDDLFNLGSVAQATVLGGQGNDLVTQNILTTASSSLQEGYINGNLGNDTLGQIAYGMSGTISAFLGGQGNDTVYVGNLQTTQVNGNIGNDTMWVGTNGGALNTANSSIYGGQGDDALNIVDGGVARTYIATTFGGNLGNDSLTVTLTTITTNVTNSTFEGGDGNDTIDGSGTTGTGLTIIGDGPENGFQGMVGGADFLAGGDFGFFATFNVGSVDTAGVQSGGAGDSIFGGVLNDVLNGNDGQDTLSGGTGSNRFVFDGGDLTGIVRATSDQGNIVAATSLGDVMNVTVTRGATDIITDWSAAAGGSNVIQNAFDNRFISLSANGIGATFSNTTGIQVVRGSWNSGLQMFTLSATGADALVATTSSNVISSTTVLQGAGNFSFSQANFI